MSKYSRFRTVTFVSIISMVTSSTIGTTAMASQPTVNLTCYSVDERGANKDTLAAEISEANNVLFDIIVSVDGTDVSFTDMWVTQNERNIFRSAIDDAQMVF